jgi:fibro-slime domain-containing protein
MRCTSAFVLLVGLAACGPKVKNGIDGSGGGDDDSGTGDGSTVDGLNCGELLVTLRDFQSSHPDFEKALGDDRGLVKVDLGAGNKPEYAPAGATGTVSGKTSFDQWYRDVAGTNQTFTQTLALVESPPGTFTFDDQEFFPLDGMGFGNEGNPHNFHFTSEIHGTFTYKGGEVFQFIGDDDVFVFVNKKLALDLGGIHGPENQTVNFDASAAALGITTGQVYQLDVFHAERHTTQSTFRMVTTIDCFIIQ